MSISTTATKDSYAGNNSIVTQYPITFKYFEESHISVYFDGVLQTKGAGADYVMGGDGTTSTGYITTNVAQAGTVTVTIVLDVPLDQPVVLQETGSLPAKTIEVEGFDRLNMQVRRVWRKLGDVLTFSSDEAGASTGTADNLIGFDGSGDIAEIPNSTFLQQDNNLSELANAPDQAAAQTNLNVDPAGTDNSTDVTKTGAGTYISLAGQVLTVDAITESDISDLGAYIENVTGSPLSELQDATITTPSSGQILSWNGSAWVNSSTDAVGGMLSAVYDPNTVGSDAFDMDNMVEGGNTKILTSAERTNIGSAMQPTTYDPNTVAGDAFDSVNHTYTPAGTGAVDTTVETKLRESVSVKDFGAVGDGVADDTTAVQAFFTHLANNGGSGYLNKGIYKITTGLVLSFPTSGFHVFGSGDESCIQLRSTTSQTALSISTPYDTVMENFLIDCGHSVTSFASHGYSFSNANNVTMRGVNVIDHRNSAGLMFLTTDVHTSTSANVNGDYRNCYIIDSYSDSKGNGQNGFLLESAYSSAIINCHVKALDRTGSPCIGLQLKNQSRYSQIIGGSAEGCLIGAGYGGNYTGAGAGAYFCRIEGLVVKDCESGVVAGKTTSSKVDCFIDMADSTSNLYGVWVTGNNTGLEVKASISNIAASKIAAKISSNKTELSLAFPDGIGSGEIAEIDSGVDYTRLSVSSIAGIAAQTNILDYITDNSGSSNNTVHYAPACATAGLADIAVQYFNTAGNGATYLSYAKTSNAFTFRLNGSDELFLNSSWLSPVDDNIKSLGRATQRWSTVYAGTGSINTSDDRQKTYLPIEDAEKAAALEIKSDLRKFKFNDSIAEKGDDARIHFGASAQTVGNILTSHGLDPHKYGFFCHDTWEAEFEDGVEVLPAGDRYGIRYSELLSFIISAM